MPLLDCGHYTDAPVQHVCRHLLENRKGDFYWRFTGKGVAYDLICAGCRQDLEKLKENLRTACPECFEGVREDGSWDGFAGQPEVKERETGLHFEHERVSLATPLQHRILAIQPASSLDRNLWVALTEVGQLLRLDLDSLNSTVLCQLPESSLDLADEVSLHLSTDGQVAAVVNIHGQHGVVLDLNTGKATMRLDRGDYRNENCTFPVAFFKFEDRLLLVHGTDWNRLDVTDPWTDTRLTGRSPTSYEGREQRPEHYLDYFHCGLAVSPNHEYIADNGWVWQPGGVVAVWSLDRWLRENPWESEDGPTLKDLCLRDYYWDGPLCWIADHRLAIWGYGRDEQWLLPAVRIFDVVLGEEERWFPGPKGNLVFDGYLFSFDKDEGTSVWDVDTGERQLRDTAFCPLRYHCGTKAFLTLLPDGQFQISRLRGKVVDPSWLSWNGGTVQKLAQAISEDRGFDRLAILADALEQAGCTDAHILNHCRQPGEHVNACWVVDLLLGGNHE